MKLPRIAWLVFLALLGPSTAFCEDGALERVRSHFRENENSESFRITTGPKTPSLATEQDFEAVVLDPEADSRLRMQAMQEYASKQSAEVAATLLKVLNTESEYGLISSAIGGLGNQQLTSDQLSQSLSLIFSVDERIFPPAEGFICGTGRLSSLVAVSLARACPRESYATYLDFMEKNKRRFEIHNARPFVLVCLAEPKYTFMLRDSMQQNQSPSSIFILALGNSIALNYPALRERHRAELDSMVTLLWQIMHDDTLHKSAIQAACDAMLSVLKKGKADYPDYATRFLHDAEQIGMTNLEYMRREFDGP